MVRVFGHRWVANYGETDDGTWLAGLQGLTVSQLGGGLRAMLDEDGQWPPTLVQFRQLCLTASSAGIPKGTPHSTAYRRLPPPRPWSGPTEAGKAGLRDALAVVGLRPQPRGDV